MAGSLLVDVGITFTAIAIGGALAYRFSLSVIPAYIVVGMLVGPNEPTSLAGVPTTLVENSEFIEVISELGIVLLLFFLGLEFSVSQLLADRNRILTIGTIDFVINFGLGLGLGVAFGLPILETLFLAGIVYISSSAIITKSLIENGWVANPEGTPILGTLVYEDILIAVYLAVLSAVALGEGTIMDAATSVATAIGFLVVLTLVAWYGTEVFERVFAASTDELFVLRMLGVTTLVAGGALAAGLSEAVAAFFVGMAFSTTGHRERIERLISPLRDLFAAAFFFAIGLRTDVTLIGDIAFLLLAAVVVTTLGKLVSGILSGRVYGLSQQRSVRVGFGLVPRGEFSLVLAALATTTGREPLQSLVPAFAVGYVLVMSILGTLFIQYGDALGSRIGLDGWGTSRPE